MSLNKCKILLYTRSDNFTIVLTCRLVLATFYIRLCYINLLVLAKFYIWMFLVANSCCRIHAVYASNVFTKANSFKERLGIQFLIPGAQMIGFDIPIDGARSTSWNETLFTPTSHTGNQCFHPYNSSKKKREAFRGFTPSEIILPPQKSFH